MDKQTMLKIEALEILNMGVLFLCSYEALWDYLPESSRGTLQDTLTSLADSGDVNQPFPQIYQITDAGRKTLASLKSDGSARE